MAKDTKEALPASHSPPPPFSTVVVEEKNGKAEAANPILASLPAKFAPPTPASIPPPAYSPAPPQPLIERVRRKLRRHPFLNEEKLSAICIPIFLTWLLVASFFAGLLFYRYFGHRRAESTFYRWCGTDYLDEEADNAPQRLEQKLEIDPDALYERIQVPRFGINRPAVFVHDFRKNLTAIVDVLGERCFLKDLDRTLVAPPKSFIDLIQKMEKGYYAQNPRVIRETYRVGGRLGVDQLAELGSAMVSKHCADRDVYQLERVRANPDDELFRHRRRRDLPNSLNFAVLSGANVELQNVLI